VCILAARRNSRTRADHGALSKNDCTVRAAAHARSAHYPSCAILARMLIVILIILLLLFGGGGYYMGPGVGYYGGGGLSLILLIVILFLLFGRGRSRL
jgi:hypothetical protein